MSADLATAQRVAGQVTDPEMPMLTLADLGVLRDVEIDNGVVTASITPTYLGCPALATMRDDLVHRLGAAGFDRVDVRVVLDPPWTSDWISEAGRKALAQHGLSAPGSVRRPVGIQLGPVRRNLVCPRCGSSRTSLVSEFGATACKAQYRCNECLEPFEHVKEI
ncbi:phenylacetate-CoA oxygenase subunit PaaJ [Kineosporia sp. NBRC 101677]|uniref:1,2-phenylacetyl-CoA epoxidase subunit PaaD n=1 Tax=Kineosporia sp. NBRC 101677 TaxID=3032197 RepID=UPI0024A00661|nr:1,2-phenylacetyl-CoA epoxidase subunit PaaD [Kineosporia sp. NBRC 101677]GLY14581.1 phenylacetate-CoA oxygenase subunit PaaJ [Kineosporia sp. NBRC 101677]